MDHQVLDHEVFAFRDGEISQLFTEPPPFRWFAVMARSIAMPEGPRVETAWNGKPVETAAIVAVHMKPQGWSWLNLSPPTKAAIAEMLFHPDAERDRWYYVGIRNITQRDIDEAKAAQEATAPADATPAAE